MPSRRQIREAALQFLYCTSFDESAPSKDLTDSFWNFINESDQRKLLSAVFRMVHHLSQGRDERYSEWIKRQQHVLKQLALLPEAYQLTSDLERIAESETKWSKALEHLQRLSLDGDDSTVIALLETGLNHFFTIDRGLQQSRTEFLLNMEQHPQLKGQLEAVAASIRRLQRISERLRMVEQPENFPEQLDVSKLRESKSEMHKLRNSAASLVGMVHEHCEEVDQVLVNVIENYSPERIDPVDRAILRLATCELMHTMTPSKVILNEAIEMAKRYGTSDSSRFVNGVLDKIASQSSED